MAFVNSATGTSDAGATTLNAGAANHTTGNLVVVVVSWTTAGVTANVPTDTAGNTYVSTGQKAIRAGSTDFAEVFYAKNITGNATNVVRANLSGSATFRRIQVLQYSGADTTSPLDTGGIATNTGTSLTVASFNTTATGVVVAGATCGNNRTYSAGSGFIARVTNLGTDTGAEDKVASAAAAQTAPFTLSASAEWWEAAAGFKDAGGSNITVNGVAGPLVLSTTTPAAKIDGTVTGVVGTVTLGASAPAVLVAVSPTVGALTLGAAAPAVRVDVTHTVGALTLAGSAPAIAVAVVAPAGQVTLATTTPALVYDCNVTAAAGVLTLGAGAHTVDTGATPVSTDVPYFPYYPSAMRHR